MSDTIAHGTRRHDRGGGIGGLTTALALHRVGIECEVSEATPEIHPQGVGINPLPHSTPVLTLMGLDAHLAASGIPPADLEEIARGYRRIAGFERHALNAQEDDPLA